MLFDWSINLGHILTILAFVFGGLSFALTIRSDIGMIRNRIDLLDYEMKKIAEILVTLARQDERLNNLSKRIDCIKEKET